ncbi:hypothetical protein HPC49_34490 [Pyxidicoccus fallax]|uniref:Uncharacterized protein n=1 Tax=Pyxidicoccus fallax TaxID=394095 RepID=A0A848LW57_9BACT|nr:hypothetical protein [Pyxidicoccus fallax]NMO21850.1 hypothetical protein [Pyxidicoccus fallax]NPC83318.1 hypothetical protein [Pyxidicoccus fallax]
MLREIHTLAKTYHWREPDILPLTHARRQEYLRLIAEEEDARLVRGILSGD